MAKKKCPKCAEKNDIDDKQCFYCNEKLKPAKKKVSKKTVAKKFLKSEIGLAVTSLVALGLLALSATAGAGYFNKASKPTTSTPPQTNSTETNTGALGQTQKITQPNSSSQSTNKSSGGNTSASNNSKAYVPSTCTNKPIKFKTVYQNDSSLYSGQTVTDPGYDGYEYKCTADSNGHMAYYYKKPPEDAIVYTGTKVLPVTPTGPSAEAIRAKKIADCIAYIKTLSPNSSAYMQCYTIY